MDELNQQENKGTLSKGIVPFLLLALLSALFYYKDSVLSLFGDKTAVSLAEVTAFRNDVRRKDSKSIDFQSTQNGEQIYHGDSLSTGASSTALVTFKSGQVLNVDQNSLIIFDELTDTPEFVKGNVKISVKGKMKLKVDNEIIEVDGGPTRSDIQIYKDEKTKVQKIVLLQGAVQIKDPEKKEVVPLEKNIPVEPKKVVRASDILNNTHLPANIPQAGNNPVVLGRPPAPIFGNYKLYDYYSRMLSSNSELNRNNNFTPKQNFSFLRFEPAQVSVTPQPTESKDPKQNLYTVRITDPISAQGYVVEVSKDENFIDGQTLYAWKNSYFTQNFPSPGNYFMRYRKVLDGQTLTDYSPVEKLFVPEKVEPAAITQTEPVKKNAAPTKKVVKNNSTYAFKEQSVAEPRRAGKRKPTAIPSTTQVDSKAMQSSIQAAPAELIRNQNYTLSNIGISVGQTFLVSGQQLANAAQINTSYGLQVSGLYWMNQNGFRASYAKALSSQTSANLVSQAEFEYLRRFSQPWVLANGGGFQYYVSVGLELYQNSQATSDFVDSYTLYKLGIGASMPIFNFWTLDGQVNYGFGDSQKSSLFLSTRANYFFTKKVSLGIGFRARKFDYYLLDQKNYESLSETYTILNMYY